MTFIARVEADVSDFTSDAEVQVEYGEVREDFSTLDELLEGSDVDMSDCTLSTYVLAGDAQYKHGATHFCIITMGSDPAVGKLFLMEQIIDGPCLLMLSNGEKLKGFHCEDCAMNFVQFFLSNQAYWKRTHHEAGSINKETPKATVH